MKLFDISPRRNLAVMELVTHLKWSLYRVRSQDAAPIFVYSNGKAGTSTITSTLAGSGNRPVIQVHTLSPRRIEENLSWHHEHGRPIPSALLNARYWFTKFNDPQIRGITIISSVRDPVATNVSSFFQNIDAWYDDIQRLNSDIHERFDDVATRFYNDFPHDIALNWFDTELKSSTELNVYSKPFTGGSIQTSCNDRFRLAVLRLEDFDEPSIQASIADFLHYPHIQWSTVNRSDDKVYFRAYEDFKRLFRPTEDYLQRMYNSKFARHFYSESEIENFISKWRKEG